jgi:hypothetical protein
MQENRSLDQGSASAEADVLTEEAAEIAAYDWNVDYLKECEERTRDLRDKAYFLGLNKLAAALEAARNESQAALTLLVLANAVAQGAASIARCPA